MTETVSGWVSDHFWPLVAGATVLGIALRTGYILVVGPHAPMGLDAAWYVVQGHAITQGHGYVDPRYWLTTGQFKPTVNFPPLWAYVLSVADRLGLGTSMRNQFVGVFFGSVSVVLTGLIGRKVAGAKVGVVAALLVACSPLMIAADASLMAEPLYVVLILAAVLCAFRVLDDPSPWRFATVGLFVGLAAVTRADALFLAPIMLVVLIWRSSGVRARPRVTLWRRVGLAAAMTVATLVPVGVWTAYASNRMGGLVLATSNSGNMFTGANCGSTYYGNLLGAWDENCASNLAPDADELAWAAKARTQGLDYARDHASRVPLVVSARVLRVWGLWDPVQTAHLEVFETRNLHWQIFGWGYHMVVLITALVGAVVARRRRLRVAPIVAVFLGVVVTAILSNGNQRFRLAADPLVAVLAAVALVAFVFRRQQLDKSDERVPDD